MRYGSATAVQFRLAGLVLLLVSSGLIQGCAGKNSPPPLSPPSNLTYPQLSIKAIMNQALGADVPTVTGTVSGYAVSPALPAGLNLNSSTGAISGTPTALAASASYTVTASNTAGSTTATLQITVFPAPPIGLSYAQPNIVAIVNQAITPDVPTVTGTVASYSVSPALPSGLLLDDSTGTIAGAPNAVTARATYTVTASNAGGSTTATVQITVSIAPPTNLSYSQGSIAAVADQTITPDIPVVTGEVDSYSVSPALPVGLMIDSHTGEIFGRPVAPAALSTYTVSASNTSGAATTTLEIAVAAAPPLTPGMAYPAAVIFAWVGHDITPDIPGISGAPTSFVVSPALPSGLSLDPGTGIISGTPVAETPQATYTVTGSNSDGSLTVSSSVTITVSQAPIVLLYLSSDGGMANLLSTNSRIFSQENGGNWLLWDYKSGAIVASGNAGGVEAPLGMCGYGDLQSAMAGTTLAIGVPDGIEFRASSDGHVIGTIVSPGAGFNAVNGTAVQNDCWQLAPDGSYVSIETPRGLFVYNPAGQLLVSRPVTYATAQVPLDLVNDNPSIFAAPGQVQIANGPDGPNAIETISVPGGVSTVSPPYQGEFQAWFTDGGRFTTLDAGSNTIWTYSNAGVQQAAISLPASMQIDFAGGAGNWMWITGSTNSGADTFLNVYPVGSTTASLAFDLPDLGVVDVSGTTLAAFPIDSGETARVIDLSGGTPVETDFAVPPLINHAEQPGGVPLGTAGLFAAPSSTQWVAEFGAGLILDGASLSSAAPRYLGTGPALSFAGSDGRVAIATGSGQIFYFDPANPTPQGSVGLMSDEVQISKDGSVLAASSEDGSLLNIYSLPAGTLSHSFSYSAQVVPGRLTKFSLSSGGTTIAQIEIAGPPPSTQDSVQISPASGGSNILSLTGSAVFSAVLSPDGTLAALNSIFAAPGTDDTTSDIYQNGQFTTEVEGGGSGWIDDGQLLVSNSSYRHAFPVGLQGCTIYSPTGAVLVHPAAYCGGGAFITSDAIYDSRSNAIYSLSTGQAMWTSPYPWSQGGAATQSYVVFVSDGRVIAVPY